MSAAPWTAPRHGKDGCQKGASPRCQVVREPLESCSTSNKCQRLMWCHCLLAYVSWWAPVLIKTRFNWAFDPQLDPEMHSSCLSIRCSPFFNQRKDYQPSLCQILARRGPFASDAPRISKGFIGRCLGLNPWPVCSAGAQLLSLVFLHCLPNKIFSNSILWGIKGKE